MFEYLWNVYVNILGQIFMALMTTAEYVATQGVVGLVSLFMFIIFVLALMIHVGK